MANGFCVRSGGCTRVIFGMVVAVVVGPFLCFAMDSTPTVFKGKILCIQTLLLVAACVPSTMICAKCVSSALSINRSILSERNQPQHERIGLVSLHDALRRRTIFFFQIFEQVYGFLNAIRFSRPSSLLVVVAKWPTIMDEYR